MKLGKKISGGRYRKKRKKKKYELPGQQRTVKLGKKKAKRIRVKGGYKKTVLLTSNFVNVKGKKLEIKNVLETPSDRFLARQNILTRGTIVETEAGKVKITNRPSQEGVINGVLIE